MTPVRNPACSTCANLGDEIANTGRGEYLSDPWYKMVRCELGNDLDLGRCPECDACFEWQDHPQYYGSGNLDEEHLRRLPESEAALVRTLLTAGNDPSAPQRVIDAAFAGVNPGLLRRLLMHIAIKYKAAFQPLLPLVLECIRREPGLSWNDVIGNYVGWGLQRAHQVIALIEADPRPRPFAIEHMLKRCRDVKP